MAENDDFTLVNAYNAEGSAPSVDDYALLDEAYPGEDLDRALFSEVKRKTLLFIENLDSLNSVYNTAWIREEFGKADNSDKRTFVCSRYKANGRINELAALIKTDLELARTALSPEERSSAETVVDFVPPQLY